MRYTYDKPSPSLKKQQSTCSTAAFFDAMLSLVARFISAVYMIICDSQRNDAGQEVARKLG